jgi:polyhydroxybutyrate depolymerase
MIRTAFTLLVAGSFALFGCEPRLDAAPVKTGGQVKTITVRPGVVRRTARLYVPSSLPKGKRVPLVVVLHGGFGAADGAAKQTGFDAQAERGKFLVVYPQGLLRSWNAGICCGPAQSNDVDDVRFIERLLDRLEADYPIDTHRVYATGISNGGMMAYRLACEAADRFAAIAPVSATLAVSGCRPSQPVALLHIHGLQDHNVPFTGGVGSKALQKQSVNYPPVRAGIDSFVQANACSPTPSRKVDGKVTTETWHSCHARGTVELITISDGGHAWPGGQRMSNVLDAPSTALDATARIWAFFAAHPRP